MLKTFAALVAALLLTVAASAATDLQRARALNKEANTLLDHEPEKAFDGDKGEVYCAWLVRLYPIQDELLKILERNPKFVGIGSPNGSHEEIVNTTRKRLAAIEHQRVQCAAAEFSKQLDDYGDGLDDELDE